MTRIAAVLVVPIVLVCVVAACRDAGPGVHPGAQVNRDMIPETAREGCTVGDDGALTYRVVPGETLTAIAHAVYGDSRLWREIALANPDVVGPDGAVGAGVVLTIPFEGR